jgi:hypothetical protein
MKTIIVLLLASAVTAAALLCGCQKAAAPIRWEYKMVALENYEHEAAHAAYKGMDTNQKQGLYEMQQADGSAGDFSFTKEVKELGRDGWELVAAVPQTETIDAKFRAGSSANIRTGKILLVFKRPEK